MANRPIDEQVVKYLTDVHSIEEQALAQMRSAPDLASTRSSPRRSART